MPDKECLELKSLEEYLTSVHKMIWKELKTPSPKMDNYRRNLQKAYIASAQNILLSTDADQTESDAFSMIRADVIKLQKEISAALPRVKDKLDRYHLTDMQVRIRKTARALEL